VVWTGLIWLRIGTSGKDSSERGNKPSGSPPKNWGNSQVAAQLAASQEELSSVELFSFKLHTIISSVTYTYILEE
jgi:hypothetical protein